MTRVISGAFAMSALLTLSACAPVVPAELSNARIAYKRASQGPASSAVPADLHKAMDALNQAEVAFKNEPREQRTRDLAYIAERKAQLAEALAGQVIDKRATAQAEDQLRKKQAEVQAATKGALADTRAELGAAEQSTKDAEAKTAATEAQLKTVQDALDALGAKEEARGLVITLSGSVLFATNEDTLLPAAQSRLEQVATALLANRQRSITIEGHTDSRGSASHNMDLSLRRADAVRSFLVSRGYDGDLIHAQGIGESRPIAKNTSADGRANNRRVEIVVAPNRPLQSSR